MEENQDKYEESYTLLSDPQAKDKEAHMGLLTIRTLRKKRTWTAEQFKKFAQIIISLLRENALICFTDSICEEEDGTVGLSVRFKSLKWLKKEEVKK